MDYGLSAEDDFFEAVRLIHADMVPDHSKPSWLVRIERPSWVEDRDGADAWAYTDNGKFLLQIKRSQRGAEKFLQEYPELDALVLIIPRGATPEDIAISFLRGLEEFYDVHLELSE